MAKYVPKTKVEPQSVATFIDAIENPQRRAEARELLAIYGHVTGYPARLYTGGMIGFGRYDYIYDSGHSGTAFATGFAPRKAELSLYGLKGGTAAAQERPGLGKYREGVSCVYVRRLSDIDTGVLSRLIALVLEDHKTRYTVTAE